MLTDIEVKRLEEVEREELSLSLDMGALRSSATFQMKYKRRKDLSLEERERVDSAVEREKDLEKSIKILVQERNALYEKRGYRPNEGAAKSWYPEPGYGPSW